MMIMIVIITDENYLDAAAAALAPTYGSGQASGWPRNFAKLESHVVTVINRPGRCGARAAAAAARLPRA